MKKLNNNDYVALNNILLVKNMNRTDLSNILNITAPGVYKIIKKLYDRNLLSEETESLSSKGGRPRTVLTINKKYKKILGIYISTENVEIGVSYLNGEIIEFKTRKRNIKINHQNKLTKIITDEIENFLEKYGRKNIAGIGLSIQGIIDSDNGIIKSSPVFKGKDIRIKEFIEDTFKLPCIVDDNIRSMLLAEKTFAGEEKTKDAFMLYYNGSLGSALLINDKIYNGINFSAGQIGNTRTTAIIEKAKTIDVTLAEICSDNYLYDYMQRHFNKEAEELSAEEVYDLANNGVEPYSSSIKEAATRVGTALSNFVNMLDVGNIIFAGDVLINNPCIKETIMNTIKKNIPDHIIDNTSFRDTELRENIEKLAPISLIINNLFTGQKIVE